MSEVNCSNQPRGWIKEAREVVVLLAKASVEIFSAPGVVDRNPVDFSRRMLTSRDHYKRRVELNPELRTVDFRRFSVHLRDK